MSPPGIVNAGNKGEVGLITNFQIFAWKSFDPLMYPGYMLYYCSEERRQRCQDVELDLITRSISKKQHDTVLKLQRHIERKGASFAMKKNSRGSLNSMDR